jgi:hypothetical protein
MSQSSAISTERPLYARYGWEDLKNVGDTKFFSDSVYDRSLVRTVSWNWARDNNRRLSCRARPDGILVIRMA